MFKSNFLESLSKVHFTVPLFIYIPVIAFFVYKDFAELNVSGWYFIEFFIVGLFVWSFTEYLLHRFIFHFVPKSWWGQRLHFIFHGVHHDYPKDAKRLVMPPSVSIPLAIMFYFLFSAFLTREQLYAFFPGFIVGYLCYDMMHYAMHHYNFKTSFMKKVKQHHMLHHYSDPAKDFGVSSPFWDFIFHSFSIKKNTKKTSPIISSKTSLNERGAEKIV
jgi:sterol desaturase/sphingolipid hydroxylase (fatty acid hydroxylase superfamily)